MDKHQDRISGELCEPLSEHATFRLGIDYGFRSAFSKGRPLSRQQYDSEWLHAPYGAAAYFIIPSYEEYLRLYDMYSETCRLRATGVGECEAAEAVRNRQDKHRDRRSGELWEPLSEHATFRLGIDYGFRSAFSEGRPMPRDKYEFELLNNSRWAYFGAPPYEEYLRLYDMYSETCRLRAAGVEECEAAEAVRKRNG